MRCLVLVLMAAMLTCAAGTLIKVGGNDMWTENVDYTQWAANKTFYVGDWLYFIFDKYRYNVLEVNKTNYENCNDSQFITNITKGGRDVFNLAHPRPYYFLSSGGYCFHGMKLAIDVQKAVQLSPSASTSSSKSKNKTSASPETKSSRIMFFPVFVVIGLVLNFL